MDCAAKIEKKNALHHDKEFKQKQTDRRLSVCLTYGLFLAIMDCM